MSDPRPEERRERRTQSPPPAPDGRVDGVSRGGPARARHSVRELDALLENATWLAALARHMLADRGLAEDVVQETWIAALRAPPEVGRQRPWLARVARNFALQRYRAEASRGRREHAAARPEPNPSAAETVARAELHAKLVQAVLALEEPYRETILWRYFEDLPAERIAERAGIDPATVRSRIARARERLRTALMERGGEPPERWLSALLPHGSNPVVVAAGGTLAGIWGSLMSTKMALGAALVIVVAAALVARGFLGEDPARIAEPPGSPTVSQVVQPPSTAPAVEPRTAEDARAVAAAADSAPSLASRSSTWRGLVRSEGGLVPLAGARISYRRGSELESGDTPTAERTREAARSDEQGRFEVPIPADREEGLWFEADGHFGCKLSPGDLPRDGATLVEVLLSPLGRIELEIVDDVLVPHQDLAVRYSIDVTRGSQDFLWSYRGDRLAGRTDAHGRVVIPEVPCGMPIRLQLGEHSGGARFLGIVHVDSNTRVLLHQVKLPRTATLVGRLVSANGRGLDDAKLEWRSYPLDYDTPLRAFTDEDGRFAIGSVEPKPGELAFDVPGLEPRELSPGVGQEEDLGTIVVPEVLELSGRLISRWAEGAAPADVSDLLQEVSVRVLRNGRMLSPLDSSEGALRLDGGEFRTFVSDGPLELLVTRGGYWYSGMAMPKEVLACLSLPGPRAGIEIPVDAGSGALEVQLSGPRPAEASAPLLHVYAARDAADTVPLEAPKMLFGRETGGSPAGEPRRTRFAPLSPGRYLAVLMLGDGQSVPLGEIAIQAGEATRLTAPEPRNFALLGRVVQADGKPAAGTVVGWRSYDTQGSTSSDSQGRFRIDGLTCGSVDLDVRHGDFGALGRRGVAVIAPETSIELVLGGFVTVLGRVRQGGEPAAGLTIGAQPVNSNDTYSAVTDEGGEFRLERLPPCRLRVWSSGRFVEVMDLQADETRLLDVDCGGTRHVEFALEDRPLEDLDRVRVLSLSEERTGSHRWLDGELRAGGVDLELPAGNVLFEVCRARSGSNQGLVAVANDPGSRVELARHTLTLGEGRWKGVLPRANLVSIGDREIVGMWGGEIVLTVECDSAGRAVVPCLPDGARVRLSGFASDGARHETIVTVDQSGTVTWP